MTLTFSNFWCSFPFFGGILGIGEFCPNPCVTHPSASINSRDSSRHSFRRFSQQQPPPIYVLCAQVESNDEGHKSATCSVLLLLACAALLVRTTNMHRYNTVTHSHLFFFHSPALVCTAITGDSNSLDVIFEEVGNGTSYPAIVDSNAKRAVLPCNTSK